MPHRSLMDCMRRGCAVPRATLIAALGVILGACGGGGGGGGGGDATGPPASVAPWSQQNRSQRMQYMREVVLPEMNKLFVAHDREHFSDFGCPTCHGENMQKVGFKMPNALPALPAQDTLAKAQEQDAKMTEFMSGEVVPKMAELLQADVAAEPGGPGFSCFRCHPRG